VSAREHLENLSSAYRSRLWFAAACVLTGVAFAGLLPVGEYRSILAPIVLGAATGAALGVVRSGKRRGQQAVEAERAWLDGLPFPVEGLWELLGEDYSRSPEGSTRLRFVLEFAEEAPEPKDLHERLIDARLLELRALEPDERSVTLVLAIAAQRLPADLAPVVHRLLDDALVPLHEQHPIARVRAGL
jgi:hypothetical protein